MALIELSMITGAIVGMAAETGFKALGQSEAAVRVRKRLRLADRPAPGDFAALYRHALVEWGVFKPEPVLAFFRDKRIVDAFERAYRAGDPAILQTEAAEYVRWADESGAFRQLEYDPRREIAEFAATFDAIVSFSRTAVEVRQDEALAHLARELAEVRAALAQIAAGRAAVGDVHFSGQFHNVIINLLSQLKDSRQTIGGATTGEPLPPLDEHGRPPLPDASRDLPPGSRVPYDPNPLFTGREDELRQLARDLLYAPAGAPVVIATGIGGIGKTQLAAEFTHRYGRYFAGGVQWVSLADGDPAAVAREVAECGLRLGLWPEAEDGQLSLDEKVRRTRRAWARPQPRLIVFDNCDGAAAADGRPAGDARDLLDEWRPEPGGARLLVTSRSDDWPAGFAARAVPTLPRPESRALLREYLERAEPPRREDDAALDAVAAELGDLPLALTLAGSYLAAYPAISVAAYLAELRAPGWLDHPSLRGQGRPERWTKHDLDVARTFRVSLDRLQPDESATDAAARRLLAGAACLVPGEPFPRELLLGMLDESVDPHRPEDALRRLLALGLLERAGEGRLRLHRLLAAFTAGALAEEMDAARTETERAVMALASQQDVKKDPRPLRQWFTHFRHVVDVAFDREDERAANLCGWLDFCLSNSGDLVGALPYSRRALAIRERVLGPEHPDTAQSLNNLGYLLGSQGDLAGARPYYERALAIWERVLGPEHPDTALALNNLGYLLKAQGDLAGARPYYERALAIRERVLGPEHHDTATSLNNLGGLLQAQGDLAGARPYYERALAVWEHALGPDHPSTAISYVNVGLLLVKLGEVERGRALLEQAERVFLAKLGSDHSYTRIARDHLAALR